MRARGNKALIALRAARAHLGEAAPAEAARRRQRRCRKCGCTDEWGCDGGCYWVEDDLCSECVGKEGANV